MAQKFQIGDPVRPIKYPHKPGSVVAVEITQADAYEYKVDSGERGGIPKYDWYKEDEICEICRFMFQVLAAEDFGFGFPDKPQAEEFKAWMEKTIMEKFIKTPDAEAFVGSMCHLKINVWDEENQG